MVYLLKDSHLGFQAVLWDSCCSHGVLGRDLGMETSGGGGGFSGLRCFLGTLHSALDVGVQAFCVHT